MSQNNTTGLLKYLNEASQIVSGWPEWKKTVLMPHVYILMIKPLTINMVSL